MSNSLLYDPLLVRYLAAELDERLRGRGCTATPFFAPDLSATLPLEGGEQLRADLHPSRGWFRIVGRDPGMEEELDAICTGVSAPLDERILYVDLEIVGRFRDRRRRLVFELHTNQWNILVVNPEDSGIVNVLRGRRAGTRALFPGRRYELPHSGGPRYGALTVSREQAWTRWQAEVAHKPADARRTSVLRSFAFTGTLNTRWILSAETEQAAFERWWWLRSLPTPEPGLVTNGGRRTPYPVPLEGWEWEGTSSLLAAMDRLVDLEGEELSTVAAGNEEVEAAVEARIQALARRLERLRRELADAAVEAERSRAAGDLLLANLHRVSKGAERVLLQDWEGEEIEIPLDPTLSPAENAAHLYESARRKRRAEERLPEVIGGAEDELERWRDALAKVRAGQASEIAAALLRPPKRQREAAGGGSLHPYRLYRTSGGLEVRVGRNARDNDRLTFRESSPNDIWLHAQGVPGSHVILRWSDPEGSPPARDLEEAAQLSALFSRARTSRFVPVYWTRRKYVRKPRGSAPGVVVPQRVKTLLVEPSPEVAEKLAVDAMEVGG